jgi:hypothetical protein
MDSLLSFYKDYVKKLDGEPSDLLSKYSLLEIASKIIDLFEIRGVDYFELTGFAKNVYLSGALTKKDKTAFYKELKRLGLFIRMNRHLSSGNFSEISWAIYVIGKFSNSEDAILLETAYENNFKLNNPILSYRCLGELDWLKSSKLDNYINELNNDNTITSKLILMYYWSPRSNYNNSFEESLKDKELMDFVCPNSDIKDKSGIAEDRLFGFEQYLSNLFNSTKGIQITKQEFQTLAEKYFKSFVGTPFVKDEDYDEFIKSLG